MNDPTPRCEPRGHEWRDTSTHDRPYRMRCVRCGDVRYFCTRPDVTDDELRTANNAD